VDFGLRGQRAIHELLPAEYVDAALRSCAYGVRRPRSAPAPPARSPREPRGGSKWILRERPAARGTRRWCAHVNHEWGARLICMQRVNIATPTFDYDGTDPAGYQSGVFRFGKQLGAQRTGTSVYELPPGQSVCPYHYEYGEEEWLIVLQGRPTLRHAKGTDELAPWDVVFFPSGPTGAHAVRNETDETVRVLMYSTVTSPAASVYPDSGKVGIWTGNPDDDVIVHRSSHVDYWSGETS
jgi:uncharacterized cupin superfamily protein